MTAYLSLTDRFWLLRIWQAAPLELYTRAAVVLHSRAQHLIALYSMLVRLRSCCYGFANLYSMLLRWLELLAMAARPYELDAIAMSLYLSLFAVRSVVFYATAMAGLIRVRAADQRWCCWCR